MEFTPTEVNLVPDVGVMLVMLVIFGLNMLIIKSWILTPYLKLREKREGLTSGSHEQVRKLREQLESMRKTIDAKLMEAINAVKQSAEQQRQQAIQQNEQLIHTAKLEAAAGLKQAREKIAQQIIEQRSMLPKQMSEMSDLVYRKVME